MNSKGYFISSASIIGELFVFLIVPTEPVRNGDGGERAKACCESRGFRLIKNGLGILAGLCKDLISPLRWVCFAARLPIERWEHISTMILDGRRSWPTVVADFESWVGKGQQKWWWLQPRLERLTASIDSQGCFNQQYGYVDGSRARLGLRTCHWRHLAMLVQGNGDYSWVGISGRHCC